MPTVVFADIVGSTGLFEQMGDANASLLMNSLTGLLGKVFEQHQGRVVKLLGDGVFAVFPDAGSAVTACVTLQSRFKTDPVIPQGGTQPIQMQMGVESGELVEIDGDVLEHPGPPVVEAAEALFAAVHPPSALLPGPPR